MKWRMLFIALTVWIGGVAGCRGPQEPSAPPSTDTESPSATTDKETTRTSPKGEPATVKGKVVYEGTPPPPGKITPSEKKCKAHLHGESIPKEDLVVNKGAIKWVIVHVKDAKGEFSPPRKPVTIDQQGCRYRPHVLAFQTGQTINIKNSDPLNHNIHTLPKKNPVINISQPKPATVQKEISVPEIFKVKCDVHPWMASYWGVFDHPFFAVTGDDGGFTISNLPAGTYTIEAWHEKLKTQSQKVTVKAGETKQISFAFQGK